MKRMFYSKLLIKLNLCMALAVCAGSIQAQDIDSLTPAFEAALEQWDVPGIAIAVVKDGEIIYARGFGVRDLRGDDPVDPDTLFAIGSTSKAFTATALGMLKDDGLLDWDDRVLDHLPKFELFDPYVSREIRIRDLLCHRSGLTRGDQLWYASGYSRDEVLHRVRYLEPTWSFRSTFGYQNIMYLAAGQIIPEVTDMTWDTFLQERIFKPIGMNDSHTSITTLDGHSNVATPHVMIDDKMTTVAHRNLDNVGPAGSIYSSVNQMAEWIKLNLANGEYNGEQVVSEEVIRETRMSQMHQRLEGRFAKYSPGAHFLNYGFGWFLSDFRGRLVAHHGGAIDGMRAQIALMPEENIGMIALSNSGGSLLPTAMTYMVFDELLGNDAEDWSTFYHEYLNGVIDEAKEKEEARKKERKRGTKLSLDRDDYAGVYRSQLYGDVEIQKDDQKLRYVRGPETHGVMSHWQHDTFKIEWANPANSDSYINFDIDARGNCVALISESTGRFERVTEKEEEKE